MTVAGSREDIRAFNNELVNAYYEGESVASIAKRSGRDRSTINKLIEHDVALNGPRERRAQPVDPRAMCNKKVLSNRHGWIGLQIARYRAQNDLTPSAMGMRIFASRMQVRNMEIGAHDFTLSEIDRISRVIEISFEELVQGAARVTA